VRADSIEVTGYPELSRRYHVSSVLLQHVQQAARSGGGLVVD
jgi:hypothetical protein